MDLEIHQPGIDVIVGEDQSIYQGLGATIFVKNAIDVIWSPQETVDAPFSISTEVFPEMTTYYYAEVTDSNGCVFIHRKKCSESNITFELI